VHKEKKETDEKGFSWRLKKTKMIKQILGIIEQECLIKSQK
jgi:hypothetical protein